MKKNLLTITMLVLSLVISITLMAVPASAQEEFYCDGTEKVTLIDAPGLEFTMNCEGDILWGLHINEFSIDGIGEVILAYETCTLVEDEECYGMSGFTVTDSHELLSKEDKYKTLDGDKLKVQFKFKPNP